MEFRETADEEVLVATTGRPLIALVFGLGLVLAGLALVAVVFIPAEVRGGDPIEWYIGIPAGVPFLVVGALVAIAQRRTKVDRRSRVVEETFELFLPVSRTTRSLDEFNRLKVRRDYRGGVRRPEHRATPQPSYAVDFAGKETFTFGLYSEKQDAIRVAQKLSAFLGLEYHDHASDG